MSTQMYQVTKNFLYFSAPAAGFSLSSGLIGAGAIRVLTKNPYPWALSWIGALASFSTLSVVSIVERIRGKRFRTPHCLARIDYVKVWILMVISALLTGVVSKWWLSSRITYMQSLGYGLLVNVPSLLLLILIVEMKLI